MQIFGYNVTVFNGVQSGVLDETLNELGLVAVGECRYIISCVLGHILSESGICIFIIIDQNMI